jgi:hypothetical protein
MSSVARAARVHRNFIHRQRDLHAAVEAAAARPAESIPANSTASYASMKADLLNLRAHNTRLQERIAALQARLSDELARQRSVAAGSMHPTTSVACIRA